MEIPIAIAGGCVAVIAYIMGLRLGYRDGRSSMWNYCNELKKNLEAETEAKNEARRLLHQWGTEENAQ
jgi:hypothetical protein